jgi:hypothetical protein
MYSVSLGFSKKYTGFCRLLPARVGAAAHQFGASGGWEQAPALWQNGGL